MRPVEALLIAITVILLFIQFNHQHFFVFRMIYERWANKCLTALTAAMMRARNRRQRRLLRAPYAWSVPRPVESWFDLHYYDGEFYRNDLTVPETLQWKKAIACAVLHNLCIRLGDNWEEEDNDDNNPCPPIAGPNIIREPDNMREILKDYIQ